jgi:copper(I)-binding protein
MKRLLTSAAMLAFVALATPVVSGEDDLEVDGAWSRASIGTSRPGVVYMTLRNTGETPVAVVGLRTEIATMPMIHATETDAQGVSRMSHMEEVEIPAGGSVAFAPGGLHVMLMDLQRPMVEGESFTMTLMLEDGGEIPVEVPILGIAARGPNE